MEERGVGGDWWIDESDERARDDEPLVRIRVAVWFVVAARQVSKKFVGLMVRYSGY